MIAAVVVVVIVIAIVIVVMIWLAVSPRLATGKTNARVRAASLFRIANGFIVHTYLKSIVLLALRESTGITITQTHVSL